MPIIAAKPPTPIAARPPGMYRHPAHNINRDILLPGQMPGTRFFRPTFTLRWGRRGRGKSLTLVAEGYHFQQAYRRTGLSNPEIMGKYAWKVAANFHNSYADITRPFLVEELTEYPEWGYNLRLLIDEFAMYAHRRKWQLTSNLNLESFMTQIRKRSIEPSAATQFPQRLDGDIVEQIDLFIDCDIETQGCGNPEHSFCAAQRVHDWWGQWTGNTRKKPWPPNSWDYDYFKWFHNCGIFFGSFVTEEIFSPIWLKEPDKNRIRGRQWGDETDLSEDERRFAEAVDKVETKVTSRAPIDIRHSDPAIADFETKLQSGSPVDIRHSDSEMAGWDPYNPDLTIGAPGEDQLAAFLRDKAARVPGRILNLAVYVSEARNINPNINGIRALTAFCEKNGWDVERHRGSPTVRIT